MKKILGLLLVTCMLVGSCLSVQANEYLYQRIVNQPLLFSEMTQEERDLQSELGASIYESSGSDSLASNAQFALASNLYFVRDGAMTQNEALNLASIVGAIIDAADECAPLSTEFAKVPITLDDGTPSVGNQYEFAARVTVGGLTKEIIYYITFENGIVVGFWDSQGCDMVDQLAGTNLEAPVF